MHDFPLRPDGPFSSQTIRPIFLENPATSSTPSLGQRSTAELTTSLHLHGSSHRKHGSGHTKHSLGQKAHSLGQKHCMVSTPKYLHVQFPRRNGTRVISVFEEIIFTETPLKTKCIWFVFKSTIVDPFSGYLMARLP